MDVKITVNKSRRKTFAIEISKEAEVIVRAPLNATKQDIKRMLDKHERWIAKRISEMESVNAECPPHEYKDGEMFWFMGKKYPLEIVETNKWALKFEDKFLLSRRCRDYAEEYFAMWYKNISKQIFPEIVYDYAEQVDIHVNQVKINNAEKRWGSCSGKGNINLSWRLIMTPRDVIDYVIIHELAHRIEMNHSPKFWDIVGKLMPDYEEPRKWIRDNSYLFYL